MRRAHRFPARTGELDEPSVATFLRAVEAEDTRHTLETPKRKMTTAMRERVRPFDRSVISAIEDAQDVAVVTDVHRQCLANRRAASRATQAGKAGLGEILEHVWEGPVSDVELRAMLETAVGSGGASTQAALDVAKERLVHMCADRVASEPSVRAAMRVTRGRRCVCTPRVELMRT